MTTNSTTWGSVCASSVAKTTLKWTTWSKGIRSSGGSSDGNGGCVEVKLAQSEVLIRDSKYLRNSSNDPDLQPIISVTVEQWHAFVKAAATRESSDVVEPRITVHTDGSATVLASDGTTLEYTNAEWDAFTFGVRDGEFDDLTEGWHQAPQPAATN